jgi:hypothetical protein
MCVVTDARVDSSLVTHWPAELATRAMLDFAGQRLHMHSGIYVGDGAVSRGSVRCWGSSCAVG